jgi:hypothetical protein
MVTTSFDQGSGTSPILAGDLLLLDVTLEEESYLFGCEACGPVGRLRLGL